MSYRILMPEADLTVGECYDWSQEYVEGVEMDLLGGLQVDIGNSW